MNANETKLNLKGNWNVAKGKLKQAATSQMTT